MEYLLIDAHRRFLGTMNYGKSLAVGDIFQAENEQTYAVVGTNWSNQLNSRMPSLTIVRINQSAKNQS